MDAHFKNLDRLKRRLEAIPPETRKELLAGFMEEATALVADIKSLAPVDPEDGGQLVASVGWTDNPGSITEAERGRARRGGISHLDVGVVVFEGGPDAPYAPYVEFGTEDATAQPHFFPPFRALRKRIKRRAAARARKAARAAVKKG